MSKYPGILRLGSKNTLAVNQLKTRLNIHMGSTLDPKNGNYGASTEAVVKQFQTKKQLNPDGVVGDLTWERLFEEKYAEVKPTSSVKERALALAITMLFVREATGKNDGEYVERFLKSVGLGKGYAWCMAFVFWSYEQASVELFKSNPLKKTPGVLDQWNNTPKENKFTKPQVGDIFIMDFVKGSGHTGIVEKIVGDRIHTVEGNTSADPTSLVADREGNGVFERSRKISSINKGFIRYS